ncbi:MAG: methylmalonyl-CoA epimerase [Bdellovibrionales bacterium CG10_big_fil_rev_8_21_14_0_10_45_34]|nr:MAG: methylmalonyl-CoA epimerase [Bdellovibrionales bacterium CG10_big_fil_rev_8_21_14_0_10_45_34]
MFKDFEIDHIGVAVRSLEEGFKLYGLMGFDEMYTEVVPSEKVKVGFIEFANGARVELLEPISDDSVIAKFLKKRGPGFHHICYRVKDIEVVMKALSDQGVRMIDSKPRIGAHNCKVAFVHPSSASGMLVELSQKVGS